MHWISHTVELQHKRKTCDNQHTHTPEMQMPEMPSSSAWKKRQTQDATHKNTPLMPYQDIAVAVPFTYEKLSQNHLFYLATAFRYTLAAYCVMLIKAFLLLPSSKYECRLMNI